MAPPTRTTVTGRGSASVRQGIRTSSARPSSTRPSVMRPPSALAVSSRNDRSGAASRAESVPPAATSPAAGMKRKERDFDSTFNEETNINVVVRCRGRNQREVQENSAVVVKTNGVMGKHVELSMGPNALSNKTYAFDRVFSQAADQSMIFDDVVKPILGEMLAGFNCTIFAYGQTGTGKTYTMSGDMAESLGLLAPEAGIIPRVLQALFNKLDADGIENCVRCSFIELYNEELRDLLTPDENAKLKIYDDVSKKGHMSTMVQGVEERHITNAAEGIARLQEGSIRRQVAATKCNDLSSRSHTVFTITIHQKRSGGNDDDFISLGKLNLVDLAGSENIQRSGAENKRAAEAGLINKSLLTLGRVINALVDKSSHIPYRESKLTRLLQDSLGGRTKTCIIATISPAKSNLEETISTLDYAFRAKNIRNKPQVNALINKKALLKEFTAEIEKIRTELIATRLRNGVHLTNEAYEEMTVQSESRRILADEQAAKIETLESNLRNKVQELFTLTSSFMGLKKEHEGTKAQLDETQCVLDQTELVLTATRKTLAEETHIRKAHQKTEQKLTALGGELITTLKKTVGDVGGLRAKNKRKSDLQELNRSTWTMSQAQVTDVTEIVEKRIQEFRRDQEGHISSVSKRMQDFVREELQKLSATQSFLDDNLQQFKASKGELLEKKQHSKDEMDNVLEEIKVVRDNIKERVGESLQAIATAAERIAADVVSELDTFHTHLHTSYSSLGKDFKSIFEELLQHLSAQRSESDTLRRQLEEASKAMVRSNESVSAQIQTVVNEERKQGAEDRQRLLAQITGLINAHSDQQESRLAGKAARIQKRVEGAKETFEGQLETYSTGMDTWDSNEESLLQDVAKSRDTLKSKLKDDWITANEHSTSIQNTTKSVHAETVRVVDEQMKDLDVQMTDLDDFVARARSENAEHHAQHSASVEKLSGTVGASFSNISSHYKNTFDRVQGLESHMKTDVEGLQADLRPLDSSVCQPLSKLRNDISTTVLQEYEPTGLTPEKVQYRYPTELPRTTAHEVLLAGMQNTTTPSKPTTSPSKATPAASIFNDFDALEHAKSPSRPDSSDSSRNPLSSSLREVNANLTTGSLMFDPSSSTLSALPPVNENTVPLVKKSTSRIPSKPSKKMLLDGFENMPPSELPQTPRRRKSPRRH
ncbi:Kinesin-like protein bimC [Cytospora mali]|uniref:Kinesin-like protein bimC n=1 Tax=Cytospora mali TaxID=578113 RepID=A0A194VDF0_CYTMA|nr:Kinesin-like protein bimC [Valsa mali var. pyri (nom. inval.)]